MDDTLIREVEPEDAEAVMTVRVFIPGVVAGAEDRHYLLRRLRRSRDEVESVTVGPDGSVTARGTVTVTEGVLVARCSHADGRGRGDSKTVSVFGQPGGVAAVRVSMRWTGSDCGRGDIDEELVVPWLGRARRELGGGAWLAAEITSVDNSAEPRYT